MKTLTLSLCLVCMGLTASAQYMAVDSLLLADRARPFNTFKVLPVHMFHYDAPNLRLGWQTGTDFGGWQFEVGYIAPLSNMRDNPDEYQNLNGLAVGINRYIGLVPRNRIYGSLNLDFRQMWFNRQDWVGQDCQDGRCNYERFTDIDVSTQIPSLHVMIGHSSVGTTTNIQIDYELGVGYKWGHSTDESLEDLFWLDIDDRQPNNDWIGKFSLRFNVNVGFRNYK